MLALLITPITLLQITSPKCGDSSKLMTLVTSKLSRKFSPQLITNALKLKPVHRILAQLADFASGLSGQNL